MENQGGKTLEGKVAIVTGAGRGIGRAEAIALADAGCAVVVNDLGTTVEGMGRSGEFADQVATEIVGRGGRAVANYGDVAEKRDAEGMIAAALSNFGRLDFVVSNAGNQPPARVLPDVDLDDLDTTLRVHVRGNFCMSIAATRYWREEARRLNKPVDARLIITSSEAYQIGAPWRVDYCAAKSALIGLTLGASVTCVRFGVKVNAICPRANTRMTRPEGSESVYFPDQSIHDPDVVAPVVVALCGPSGERINGQIITCGSGRLGVLAGPSVRAELGDEITSVSQASGALDAYFQDDVPPYVQEIPAGKIMLDKLRDGFDFLPR